jgi:hypothetical protein
MFSSRVLYVDIKILRRLHNKIIDATNVLVKSNSPHLNVNHLKVDNNSNGKEILENLNKITPIISHPEFSHIFLK